MKQFMTIFARNLKRNCIMKTEKQLAVAICDHKNINIESLIHIIRGQRVMFDSDLAILYGVETRALNQAVKRNLRRFPDDFMFQITKEEWNALRSQIVTLEDLKSQNVISNSVDECHTVPVTVRL